MRFVVGHGRYREVYLRGDTLIISPFKPRKIDGRFIYGVGIKTLDGGIFFLKKVVRDVAYENALVRMFGNGEVILPDILLYDGEYVLDPVSMKVYGYCRDNDSLFYTYFNKNAKNVRDLFGFDEHLSYEALLEYGTRVRVQGDIVFTRIPLEDLSLREKMIAIGNHHIYADGGIKIMGLRNVKLSGRNFEITHEQHGTVYLRFDRLVTFRVGFINSFRVDRPKKREKIILDFLRTKPSRAPA